jgi:hypothetical protein
VIVIVASAFDASAARLAERWQHEGAAVLACSDLSTAGWRYRLGRRAESRAVVAGQLVDMDAISAVLTRRPCIFPVELTSIDPGDREYVAAEMNAFLLAWLSELACPVLNQPTPTCLAGPGWPLVHWLALARDLGIETSGAGDDPDCHIDLTVIGDACFNAPDASVAIRARQLAREAGVQMLTLRFRLESHRRPSLFGVNLWPDLDQSGPADAALEQLLAPARGIGAAR